MGEPISFIVLYVIDSKVVSKLILAWSALIIVALVIVKQKVNAPIQASTRERKLFHGLVLIVMISGIKVDIEFTYLSSLIVLAFFLYLECVHVFNIGKISKLLND